MVGQLFQLFHSFILFLLATSVALGQEQPSETYTKVWQNTQTRFYEKCNETLSSETIAMTCYGIPPNCQSSRSCTHGGVVWEDRDFFGVTVLGPLDNSQSSIIPAIGFYPFHKEGSNLTASCKPTLTISDFRILFYQYNSTQAEEDRVPRYGFSGGTHGIGKDDKSWEFNCRRRLADAMDPDLSDGEGPEQKYGVVLDGQIFHYFNRWTPTKLNLTKAGFLDGSRYTHKSENGKVYSNFEIV